MSDMLEPPSKRARFDEAADGDVPGSPVDDLDDDFYDEPTPVKLATPAVDNYMAATTLAAAECPSAGLPSLHLPGLGLFSKPVEQQPPVTQPAVKNDDPDASEVCDSEPLYDDEKPEEGEIAAVAAPEEPRAPEAPAATPAVSDAQPKTEDGPSKATEDAGVKKEEDSRDAEFLRAAEANKGNANAEWELDSQAESESTSDSSSDDSDDSSDEEDSDEGELLDPAEQVRLLMMESEDTGGASGPAEVRTLNEVPEVFEKPDITVTETTKKTDLGKVESIVGNMVVIKANTSGDYQVLESGSALCLANGTVVGKVAEVIGRVQEPRYSVGFTDPAEIATLGIAKDTTIYYVDEHSSFLMTEPLKHQKFTDASNLHDEEGDVEFSDDEKEAEHKRKLKEAKRARNDAKNDGDREPQERSQHRPNNDVPVVAQATQYQGGGLNYGSDDDDDLGMYKPLPRPDHFENIVGAGAPVEDRSHVRRGNRGGRGGWPDRGRGFRGRGRGGGDGGRGGGGNQRGNHQRGGRGGGPPTGPSGHGHAERGGKHHDNNRGRNQHRDNNNRAAASASPSRPNHNRGRGGAQPQHSPGRANRKHNRQAASPPAASASPKPATTNAYTQNAAINNNAWSMPTASPAPQQPYAYGTTPQPAIPAGAYVNPAFYPQQTQTPAVQQNPQQQQNLAAQWAQWFQLAAAMQNQPQAQPQPQAHVQAQPIPPPNFNVQQQSAPQAGTPSIHDILRTLQNNGQPPNR
jgi:H/ACA ribonucleoprotein complex non-core subunit NAF1